MRVAVLGGSFDPIHQGHLMMAKTVLKKKLADEVWFMPAAKNPLKERSVSDFDVRAEMIKAATAPYRKMKLCTLENELPYPSYTINTVKALIKLYPGFEFSWIIGEDQAEQLHKWKDIDELKSLIHFLVFERNGSADKKDDLIWIKGFEHPASSTLVRQGHFEYLPKSVVRVILEKGLYFDQICAHHVSQYRYEHSLAVAETAVELAKYHHVDPTKAYVAAMMHDVCKEMDKAKMKRCMEICFPALMSYAEPVWHGWLGFRKLKEMGIYDDEILSAVYHHVLGDGRKVLDKIIYIADKSNPKRHHDITEEIELAKVDLDASMILIQENYRKRKAAADE